MTLNYLDIVPERSDGRLIRRIVKRAQRNHPAMVPDPLTLEMDLCAVHVKGPGLRLRDLLEADNWNFLHDIGGISTHIDRSTGELLRHFVPRYAVRP